MSEPSSYILRIQKDELERQLFGKHIFYVNISRSWSRGIFVLFVKKDLFVSSGVIDRFVDLDEMEEGEKRLCIENNWYGKILFARLTRFVPPVPVRETLAAGQNPLALHGSNLSNNDAAKIEEMAAGRIIS
ncbi:MAG: hypothetical protein AB1351_01245 [Thermoproteota archaeon]